VISRRQLWGLLALTLMWGVNWPMMKLSLQQISPLYFRASTMLLGASWLFAYVAWRGERMWPRGREWWTIVLLGLPNVLGWHTLSILGVQELASGRAAILGFTMPIFTVLIGAAFFGERITPRVRLAVISVSVAIGLLLWHEVQSLSGKPVGIAWMLGAAVFWALGTLMFRRAHLTLSPLVVTVWMLLLGSVGLWALAFALNQPSSYGLHKLRGDLPPGWDVTLYFNDALIDFQQSRSDGLYEFDEQPLVFGRNEFRLVFNGPLGQTRVERDVFLLDQTPTRPGEIYYTAGAQRGEDGSARQTAQMDVGLTDNLAATVGLVGVKPTTKNMRTSRPEPERQYANLGLRASMAGALLSADLVRAQGGGHLVELGVRTSLAGFSLEAAHTQLKDFVSDFFSASSDLLRTRDRARISGSVGLPGTGLRLPLGLDVFREVTESGRAFHNALARLSLNVAGTSFTHSLNWQSSGGSTTSGGALQVSRRVAGAGLSSQLAYTIKPASQVSSLAITVDKSLNLDSRLNLGLVRSFNPGQTTVTAGYTRNFGSFGLGVSGRYTQGGGFGVGVQIFMALGRDPRTGRWVRDWQPLAGSGVVSARAFIDDNMNGRFDEGELPVEGVGFIMNGGGRHPVRTNSDGLAYLSRLAPKQYADVGIDAATLEDPQWQPLVPGVRVLPRPGKVHQVDFPVVMTGEIDGTVDLIRDGKQGGIGNAEVELVDAQGAVVTSVRSSTDGYYVMPAIKPGRYRLRISPVQLDKLGLNPVNAVTIEMRGDGDFINGKDFVLSKKP
jgi:drug/metabolite transporter (DMT)-like permease